MVLSQGLYPSYSDIDTYWMAACSIDTAVRNAVAAGGSLERLAILDNFCWCDSNNPERLGQLRRRRAPAMIIAVAYGTPFISGKDSMFNDFRGYDEDFSEVMISIPPTLLVSSIGDRRGRRHRARPSTSSSPGDLIYVIGATSGTRPAGASTWPMRARRMSRQALHRRRRCPQVDAAKHS